MIEKKRVFMFKLTQFFFAEGVENKKILLLGFFL